MIDAIRTNALAWASRPRRARRISVLLRIIDTCADVTFMPRSRSVSMAITSRGPLPRSAAQSLGQNCSGITIACGSQRAFNYRVGMMSHETHKTPFRDSRPGSPAAGPVAVYNCHAILSVYDAEGWITARCGNLPGIVARGKSQREALAALVSAFKAEVARFASAGQQIPLTEYPAKPESGEQERWIALHL